MSYMEEAASESGLISPELVRDLIAPVFWGWYERHKRDRLKVRVWFLRPSVRIEALRPFFEQLFGPNPLGAAESPVAGPVD